MKFEFIFRYKGYIYTIYSVFLDLGFVNVYTSTYELSLLKTRLRLQSDLQPKIPPMPTSKVAATATFAALH